jgi:hypothetical protein
MSVNAVTTEASVLVDDVGATVLSRSSRLTSAADVCACAEFMAHAAARMVVRISLCDVVDIIFKAFLQR